MDGRYVIRPRIFPLPGGHSCRRCVAQQVARMWSTTGDQFSTEVDAIPEIDGVILSKEGDQRSLITQRGESVLGGLLYGDR